MHWIDIVRNNPKTRFDCLALEICDGRYDIEFTAEDIRRSFEKILCNEDTLRVNHKKCHDMWIRNGQHLRLKAGSDRLVADVLNVLLKGVSKPTCDTLLYRGENRQRYEAGDIGFCWTNDISVAKKFAVRNTHGNSDGVLIKSLVPRSAIYALPIKNPKHELFGEKEYTCNPFKINNIEVCDARW